MATFKEHYQKVIIPKLKEELKLKNIHMVPRLLKVNVNMGMGTFLKNNKDYSVLVDNIALITGQKPVVTLSKKSISNFKLRENTPNGIKVTLRGNSMYEFLNKLINIALPRVRDFRGVSPKAFDRQGNYSIGLKEHTVFPEAKADDEVKPFPIEITIVTTAKDPKSAHQLLSLLGFPFKKK